MPLGHRPIGSGALAQGPLTVLVTVVAPAITSPEVWWPVEPKRRRRKHEIDDEYRARVYAEIAGELAEAISQPEPASAIAKVRRAARRITPAASEADQLQRFIAALQPSVLDAQRALEIARSLEYRARLLLDEEDAIIALLLAS